VKKYQVLTQWLGIDKPAWKHMNVMFQHIPKLLRAFLDRTALLISSESTNLFGSGFNSVPHEHFFFFRSGFEV
jgi:hypothetical protein